MRRKLRPLAALATVALIGAGGSYSFAANGNTGSKGSSSAPGTLPSTGSSRSKGVVVGAGDAALDGVLALEGVVVGAGDAAAEGVLAVKGSPPSSASPTHASRMQQSLASVRKQTLTAQPLMHMEQA
jgi:hypothetical protein